MSHHLHYIKHNLVVYETYILFFLFFFVFMGICGDRRGNEGKAYRECMKHILSLVSWVILMVSFLDLVVMGGGMVDCDGCSSGDGEVAVRNFEEEK